MAPWFIPDEKTRSSSKTNLMETSFCLQIQVEEKEIQQSSRILVVCETCREVRNKINKQSVFTFFHVEQVVNNQSLHSDHNGKPTISHIFLASSIGLIITAALHYHHRKQRNLKIVPRLKVADSGHVEKIERFSHYVGNNTSITYFGIPSSLYPVEFLSPLCCSSL